MKLNTPLHLVPVVGIRELYLHSTICFHGVNREDLTFSPILNPFRKQTFRPAGTAYHVDIQTVHYSNIKETRTWNVLHVNMASRPNRQHVCFMSRSPGFKFRHGNGKFWYFLSHHRKAPEFYFAVGYRSEYPRGLKRRSAGPRWGIAGSNPAEGHGCLSLVSVVCCQVEVCAMGRLLVQRIPTEHLSVSLNVTKCNSSALRSQEVYIDIEDVILKQTVSCCFLQRPFKLSSSDFAPFDCK